MKNVWKYENSFWFTNSFLQSNSICHCVFDFGKLYVVRMWFFICNFSHSLATLFFHLIFFSFDTSIDKRVEMLFLRCLLTKISKSDDSSKSDTKICFNIRSFRRHCHRYWMLRIFFLIRSNLIFKHFVSFLFVYFFVRSTFWTFNGARHKMKRRS